MDELRKKYNQILTPSFFISITLIITIMLKYELSIFDKLSVIQLLFIVLIRLSVPLIYRNSIRNFLKCILLLIITIIIINISLSRISSNFIKINSIINKVKILEFKEGRYGNKISSLLIKPDSKNKILIYTESSLLLKKNDIIIFHKKIKPVNPHKSPFLLYLFRKGFTGSLYLKKDDIIIKPSLPGLFFRLKKSITKKIEQLHNKKTSPILKALYFGNKNYIPKKVLLTFKETGVMHILAASGLHIAIISLIPIFIFNLLGIKKKIIPLIVLPILIFYLFLAGTPVSLTRAVIMFTIYAIVKLFDFDMNIYNLIFIAMIIIITVSPWEIYSMGFQLSFGATFGIVSFYSSFQKRLSSLPDFLSKSLSVTISAQIVVIPIIIFHLNEVNFTGIITNIFAIPAITLILLFSMTGVIINIFFPAINIAFISDIIFDIIYHIIKYISLLNGNFYLEKFNITILFFYLFLFISLLPFNKNKKFGLTFIVLAFIIPIIFMNIQSKRDIIVFKQYNYKKNNIILAGIKGEAIILGNFEDKEIIAKLGNEILKNRIKRISLYITDFNFKNIINYSKLIKKFNITNCVISENFQMSSYSNCFFKLLEKENCNLKLMMSDKVKELRNYMVNIRKINQNQKELNSFFLAYNISE